VVAPWAGPTIVGHDTVEIAIRSSSTVCRKPRRAVGEAMIGGDEPTRLEDDATRMLLFVYGTLRLGSGNHGLLAGSRPLGRARTVASYALFVDPYPHMVETPAVSPVVGEVYEVLPATLAVLDRLEDHPNWYRRQPIAVALDDGSAVVQAEAYFRPVQPGHASSGILVDSGDYAAVRGSSDVV
jgi:gamma-glutamylaminecyclotransferase